MHVCYILTYFIHEYTVQQYGCLPTYVVNNHRFSSSKNNTNYKMFTNL